MVISNIALSEQLAVLSKTVNDTQDDVKNILKILQGDGLAPGALTRIDRLEQSKIRIQKITSTLVSSRVFWSSITTLAGIVLTYLCKTLL